MTTKQLKLVFLVFLVTGLLAAPLVPNVYAQDVASERIVAQRNLDTEISNTQKLIDELDKKTKSLQSSLDQRESWRTLAEDEKKKKDKDCSKYGPDWAPTAKGCDGLIKLHADEIAKIKPHLDNLKTTQTALDQRMTKANEAKKHFDEIVKKTPEGASRDRAEIAEQLKLFGLDTKFSALKSAYGNTSTALNVLRLNYDNAVLGAYVKDSIVRSLNSKAFCEVATTCGQPNRKKITAGDFNDVYNPDLVHGVVDKARQEDFQATQPKAPQPLNNGGVE